MNRMAVVTEQSRHVLWESLTRARQHTSNLRQTMAGIVVGACFLTLPVMGADVTVWMSPGGPRGIWEKTLGDPFPVKKIVEDLTHVGVTEILFFEQEGRGGTFLHPTSVEHTVTSPYMKGRDYLRELLEETVRHNIKVWLAWTPPGGKYPKTEIEGLNNPALLKIYTDEIEEVARNYDKFRNLAGIIWHEVDCCEAVDKHEDDVAEFAEYCRHEFGEKYAGDKMPKVDAQDKWWRRYFLFRNHVVNEFVRQAGVVAQKHGLMTHFCSYAPEAFTGESWKWGYDIVALEKFCDRQWFNGYSVESGKPYQQVRGACIDFGPSYRGQILPRNYSYAMHGRPLSYFEYRGPVYLEEMRRYYRGAKGFTEKHGDFYTGYAGKQQKELDLYFGKENLARWVGLMARWQGGRSTARVAVAVHPNAFIMKHPLATGAEYNKKVRSLMTALTTFTDVDGLLLESQFALKTENLLRYPLIVIPEDMGSGLSKPMLQCLQDYVSKGGNLLVISTPLTTARPDLTDEKDFTRELCGVEIIDAGLSGYFTPEGGGKFWSGSVKQVRLCGAEVVMKHRSSGGPLVVKNGNAYFCTAGCSEDAAPFFAGLVRDISHQPITLADNTGLRILEGVAKDGLVCLSFWGNGKATMRLDAAKLGLPTNGCRLKDIVTGTTLGDFTEAQLAAGVPIEVKHLYQPFLLTAGAKDSVDALRGLYASADVFAGMKAKESVEDPEVPREALGEPAASKKEGTQDAKIVPRDKEVAVLDYAKKYEVKSKRSAEGVFKSWLQMIQQTGLAPEPVDVDIFLPQNRAERNRYRRIFIPPGSEWFSQAMYESMNDYVRDGGLLITCSGLLLLDANANYRVDDGEGISDFTQNTVLGVRAHAGALMHRLKVVQACPLTAGLPTEGWITLSTPASGRATTARSAEVAIISDRSQKDRADGEQPFLTYKHNGRGGCIYLVGTAGKSSDKTLTQLLSNLCSRATLEWLCAQ
ncbi:MAG: hypothetical protein HZA88_16675 [Verrucomicrobia bacterium]|nr:hypothetical protein [Verrucomicrobiota bacterium]